MKKKKKDVEEIVDDLGNISKNRKPADFNTKGITSNSTSDEVAKTGAGSMGMFGFNNSNKYTRYWGESDMSKTLGYEDTLGKDEDYDDAKKHFEGDLDLDSSEAEERMSQIGYDKKLPKDKVRLVENPKKFIEEYIDSILKNRSDYNDIVKKSQENESEKEVNPIIVKQINSLKNTLKNNNLSISDIMKHLKDNE